MRQDLQQSQRAGFGSCLGAVVDPQFAVDIAGMRFNCVQRKIKVLRNFRVGLPLSKQYRAAAVVFGQQGVLDGFIWQVILLEPFTRPAV